MNRLRARKRYAQREKERERGREKENEREKEKDSFETKKCSFLKLGCNAKALSLSNLRTEKELKSYSKVPEKCVFSKLF